MDSIAAMGVLDRWHKDLQYQLARAIQHRIACFRLNDKEQATSTATDQSRAWARAQLKEAEHKAQQLEEQAESIGVALDVIRRAADTRVKLLLELNDMRGSAGAFLASDIKAVNRMVALLDAVLGGGK